MCGCGSNGGRLGVAQDDSSDLVGCEYIVGGVETTPGNGRRGRDVWLAVSGPPMKRGRLGTSKDSGTSPGRGNGRIGRCRGPPRDGPWGKMAGGRLGYRSLSPPIISGGQVGGWRGRSPPGKQAEALACSLTFDLAVYRPTYTCKEGDDR